MKMETKIKKAQMNHSTVQPLIALPSELMPDKGKIEINGRMGAIIEVGAGFHPMPSGHENIHVNGAIQGMSKRVIADVLAVGDFLQLFVSQHK